MPRPAPARTDERTGPSTATAHPFDVPAMLGAADRAERYRSLRDEHPALLLDPAPPTYVVSRYADVDGLVRDSRSRQLPEGFGTPPWLGDGPAARMFRKQMVLSDAPDHTRLRRLVSKGFTPRTVAALRDLIEGSVTDRLDGLAGPGVTDMLRAFADHVPAAALCSILGLDEQEWPELVRRVPEFVNIFSPLPLDAPDVERLDEACDHYLTYFADLVDARARDVGDGTGDDGVVPLLIRAEQDGDRLSRDELVVTLHSFLNAGYETTQAAIGNGLLALLTHRDQWEALVADPTLADGAVEEVLRWEAPVHFTRRYLERDVPVEGGTLPAGSFVLLALAAANRDGRRFPDPDRFDISRRDSGHLAFSGGRHFCLGGHLARMELEVAFRLLVERFPRARLADGFMPQRLPSLLFPALAALPVELEP